MHKPNDMLPKNEAAGGNDMVERITRALKAAGRDALIRHKREGLPVVAWRDGKVVKIPPEQIVIPPEE